MPEIIFYFFVSNFYVPKDFEKLEGQFLKQLASKTLIVDILV